MLHGESLGPLIGAVALGTVHGVEPGHGWPVAATYALDTTNEWVYGLAASFILGVGHLVSSLAMVAVFLYAKAYFNLTQANEPITVLGTVQIGGPVSLVAGLLLLALGVREYVSGHSHGGHDDYTPEPDHTPELDHTHGHDSGHSHDHTSHGNADDGHSHDHTSHGNADDGHSHDQTHNHGHADDDGHSHGDDGVDDGGLVTRLKAVLPFVGGHAHSHETSQDGAEKGLLGIAWFAFVLGFAHEEEFEIIALCAGSNYCLELMSAYAIAVLVGIVGLTMLLIAGYQRHEERVEQYTPYLPAFSATVLGIMGLGFIVGVF